MVRSRFSRLISELGARPSERDWEEAIARLRVVDLGGGVLEIDEGVDGRPLSELRDEETHLVRLAPNVYARVPTGEGRHPTQIYEALLNFTFSAILVALFRRKKFDGQIFAVYLLGYAVLRAFVETFRGDYETHFLGILTPGQMAGVIIFSIGSVLWIWLARRPAGRVRSADAQ